METALDLRRWQEKPAGVAYRRWVIVSTGLRQLIGTRFFQILLVLAWTIALVMAAAGFVFTQSLASGGWLETWAASFGARPQAVVSAFSALVLLYPDVCIGGLFTALFWAQSVIGLGLSLIALSTVIPRLIARDRASNALTIYLSRPLTSVDYLIGKSGIVAGILVLMWTGPLILGWALSMAFAPDSDFFTYSLAPLGRALLFNLIGVVALTTIALGVSSLGKSSRTVMPLWMGVWIVANGIAQIPTTPEFLRVASFSYDLTVIRKEVFRADEILIAAAESLPLVDQSITQKMRQLGEREASRSTTLALSGLAGLVVVSAWVFSRKLRPE